MLYGTSGIVALALQLAAPGVSAEASVRSARNAQERFELTRRAHLPRARSMGSRECDVIVGRYCYWYDSTETKPMPEPPRIVAARRALVTLLDSLAGRHPENDWLVGQRVRYTMEEGDSLAALRAARSCRATSWWCASLEGLTHHVAGRYAAADSSFRRALEQMPPAQRCEWMDLRRQVAPPMAKELAKAPCDERAALAERLWRVSQPLWSVTGNDLRTEHFARHTMALLLARSANPHGMAWSSDSRELLLRFGWSEWFSRAEPSPYAANPGAVTGHDREPSYFVFPVTPSVRAPIAASSWALRDGSMPMRYAPRHIEWLGDLDHQLVRLPRGDSTRLLAFARARDRALVADTIEYLLGALRGTAIVTVRGDDAVLALDVANEAQLVSVEAFGRGTRRAERSRYSIAPIACERRCLSDLLLYHAGESDSAVTLDSAARKALRGLAVASDRLVGVYWEVGGPAAGATGGSLPWAAVTVEPERVSRARRVAAGLRLASIPTAVNLRWRVRPARAGNVALRLPPGARGRYRIRLSIEGVGSSERVVVIE